MMQTSFLNAAGPRSRPVGKEGKRMIGILIYSPKTTTATTLLASSAETHQKIRLMLRDAKQRGEE